MSSSCRRGEKKRENQLTLAMKGKKKKGEGEHLYPLYGGSCEEFKRGKSDMSVFVGRGGGGGGKSRRSLILATLTTK